MAHNITKICHILMAICKEYPIIIYLAVIAALYGTLVFLLLLRLLQLQKCQQQQQQRYKMQNIKCIDAYYDMME